MTRKDEGPRNDSGKIDCHVAALLAMTQKTVEEIFDRFSALLLKGDINRTFSCSYGQLQTSAYASGWG